MQYDALGRRTGLTDGTGTTSVTHDALGRITGITAPDTGSIGYAYNGRGQRTGLTYPDGTTVTYTYHADGQMHQVLQGGTPLATYAYDSAGRRDTLTRANGAVTAFAYDNADRLTDLQTTVGVTTTSRFQYSLDRMGQRTAVTETLTTQTRTITSTYDGLQRLTGAAETPGTTYEYRYDLAGNRTEVRENDALVADLRYNDANQVIGWSYDAAGNLLSDGTSTRSYNALNRLVVHDSASYAYNGDGVLVSDGTTTYAQDLAAPLSQVLSDGTATYLYGHDRLRAQGGPWYVGDALGSVRQTLDDAGGVLGSVQYDPWGVPTAGTPQPFGFTGELHSAGQVYLRARWYAPGQGRFVSEDPFVGFPEMPYSLHAYQYAYSNPVRWTDPSGEYVCDPEYYYEMGAMIMVNADYHTFCVAQMTLLDQSLDITNPASVVTRRPVAVLGDLFAHPNLPGGTASESRSSRHHDLTPAAERLEFVLWYASNRKDGKRISQAFQRVPFSDTDFTTDLQDRMLQGQETGEPIDRSNQVHHFLRAVDIAYQFGWSGGWVMGCLIGHEQFPGNPSRVTQCVGVSWQNLQLFDKAIAEDLAGNNADRDCYLRAIMPHLPETLAQPRRPGDPYYGKSVQDLRLSLKGWIFGNSIRTGEIRTPSQAATWLRSNLGH
jgi:RHS repeat-associated protein